MRIESESSNNSGGDRDFIQSSPGISIPYLTFLCLFTLTGSIGNLMVIGSVVTYKVSFSEDLYWYVISYHCQVLMVRLKIDSQIDSL